MDEYDCYVNIIKSVLKHSKNEKYNTITSIFLKKCIMNIISIGILKDII